jgi:DNA-binding transcriptional LysR family regulator
MIIGLEKELGVQLCDRSKRAIHLNDAGRLYLNYVNEVFNALENGRAALNDLTESVERHVGIAMGTSQIWRPMLRDFSRAYPECTIKQYNLDLDGLSQSLEEMTVDFVIAGTADIPDGEMECVPIKNDHVYLCVPQNHRLAGRESVYLKELEGEAFINLNVGTPWERYCSQLFRQAGVNVRTVVECDYTVRASLVESEFGVALTSASAYEVDLLKPNCYVPIADEFARRELALFWNPKKYMSRAACHFRDFCIDYWKTHDRLSPEDGE